MTISKFKKDYNLHLFQIVEIISCLYNSQLINIQMDTKFQKKIFGFNLILQSDLLFETLCFVKRRKIITTKIRRISFFLQWRAQMAAQPQWLTRCAHYLQAAMRAVPLPARTTAWRAPVPVSSQWQMPVPKVSKISSQKISLIIFNPFEIA